MPKPIQIDSDLYARAAAARQGKEVGTYINELIRMQLREVERAHELVRGLDEIAINLEDDRSDNAKAR